MKNTLSIAHLTRSILLGCTLVTLLAMTHATEGRPSLQLVDRIAARVNHQVILTSELSGRIQEVKAHYAQSPNLLPAADQLKQQVLNVMILESLQLQLAQQYQISVPIEQVNQALNRIAVNQGSTLQHYVEQLQQQGIRLEQIRQQLRNEMAIHQVRTAILQQRVQVSHAEIDQFLKTETGQTAAEPEYRLLHLRLASGQIEQAQQLVSQLNQGMDFTTLAQPTDLGWRSVERLPSLFTQDAPKLAPLQATWLRLGNSVHVIQLIDKRGGSQHIVRQAQIRHILIKPNAVLNDDSAQKLAQVLRQRIVAGEDFAQLAQHYSDDLGSKAEGGLLSWSELSAFVPEFSAQAQQTDQGKLSDVFKTPFGYHILQVIAWRDQDIGLDLLKAKAKEAIFRNKSEDALAHWLAELKSTAFIEVHL